MLIDQIELVSSCLVLHSRLEPGSACHIGVNNEHMSGRSSQGNLLCMQ